MPHAADTVQGMILERFPELLKLTDEERLQLAENALEWRRRCARRSHVAAPVQADDCPWRYLDDIFVDAAADREIAVAKQQCDAARVGPCLKSWYGSERTHFGGKRNCLAGASHEQRLFAHSVPREAEPPQLAIPSGLRGCLVQRTRYVENPAGTSCMMIRTYADVTTDLTEGYRCGYGIGYDTTICTH